MSSPNLECRNEPIETFISEGDDHEEPPYPSPRARELCSRCDVRVDCLQFALDQDITYGVWGGLSSYQRSQMNRKQTRKRCLGCGAKDGIITENGHEICLACGTSWAIW